MTGHLNLRPHAVQREDRADGTILLRAADPLPAPVRTTGVWLDHWAEVAPDRTFLAERDGAGWRRLSYAAARQSVRALAAGLLARGCDGPIVILSGNSIDHALLTLAAQYVGCVTVPVAEQYSLLPAARARLRYVFDLVRPALVYADDSALFADALAMAPCPVVCASGPGAARLADLCVSDDAAVAAAHANVTPETAAKLLLTSGSTSDPKTVVTTHRMMTTNQAQIAHALPFLGARPPVIVDWLPWNHVFGGSHNFNLVLAHGGTMYIDDGKPMPQRFARTLENLAAVPATLSFNVPVGFAQLVAAMTTDAALRQTYFRDLDMIFYAGASLPQETWSALETLAFETTGRQPLITSSWGLTETAPAALLQHTPAVGAGIVGVPLPGVTIKLVDDGTGRMEVRVAGDSIFERYHNAPDRTAAAFDDEGYFITGDAMRFVDPGDLRKGLRFDGRLSEDFKLSTGTWVQAAQLRLDLLSHLGGLAQDVVICGHGRDAVGVLIVPAPAAAQGEVQDGAIRSAAADAVRAALRAHAATTSGSARTVGRALVMAQPPDIGAGELTAKGNINFAKLLDRRADLVARLYDDTDPACIRI